MTENAGIIQRRCTVSAYEVPSLIGGRSLVPSPRLCGERVRVRAEP